MSTALDWMGEVTALHGFFQGWLGGELPNDDTTFEQFERALAMGFSMIEPGGMLLDRPIVIDRLRSGHGKRPELRIWITSGRCLHASSQQLVVCYEEWQASGDDPPRGRQSTVVMQIAHDSLEWLHVHETWLPESASPDYDPRR